MHPTTAQYLINANRRDLEIAAAKARRVAEVHEHDSDVVEHESDELRPTRWGIRLPRLVATLRRRPGLGAASL